VIVSNEKLKMNTTDGELLNLWRPCVGNIVTAAIEDCLYLMPLDGGHSAHNAYRAFARTRCAKVQENLEGNILMSELSPQQIAILQCQTPVRVAFHSY
jgi:hypothetical protein